jgi:hypothetical protein
LRRKKKTKRQIGRKRIVRSNKRQRKVKLSL